MKKTLYLFMVSALVCACHRAPASAPQEAQDEAPVAVQSSIFWNRDSLNYYAELALLHDDAKGQFVTGAAYYLKREGEMPSELYTVSRKEADDLLMLSAGQGYQPAKDLIQCLQDHDQWYH